MIPPDWLAVLAILGPDLTPAEWAMRIGCHPADVIDALHPVTTDDRTASLTRAVRQLVRLAPWSTAADLVDYLDAPRPLLDAVLGDLVDRGYLVTHAGRYAPASMES